MNDRTRNVLLGTAGAFLSAAAIREGISMAIDWNMVGEALDRQEPKGFQHMKARMSGQEEDQALMAQLQSLGAQLERRAHKVVHMESYDGTGLTGHLFEAERPRRVILAMHGWRSGWARDFCAVADFFQDTDCTVLYAQQRGQGDSGGEYMGFGMIERYDCREWVNWLNAYGFEDLPIYLVGISMGATTVLMAAGFHLPANVLGVIADCGFTSPKAEWKHIGKNNLGLAWHQKRVDSLCRRRIELDSDAYSTLDAMQTCEIPILFVHGKADAFVPPEMTLENYEACKSPRRLLLVEGANHGMSYLTDPQTYETAVRDFWQEQEQNWTVS